MGCKWGDSGVQGTEYIRRFGGTRGKGIGQVACKELNILGGLGEHGGKEKDKWHAKKRGVKVFKEDSERCSN